MSLPPMATPPAKRAGSGSSMRSGRSRTRLRRADALIFCPKSGKILGFLPLSEEIAVMSEPIELADLVDYLARTTRLSRAEAVRLIDEVLAFLDERPEEFVCRRHRVLQSEGLSNRDIFVRLAAELDRWRFRAPAYSERQLRRMIYG